MGISRQHLFGAFGERELPKRALAATTTGLAAVLLFPLASAATTIGLAPQGAITRVDPPASMYSAVPHAAVCDSNEFLVVWSGMRFPQRRFVGDILLRRLRNSGDRTTPVVNVSRKADGRDSSDIYPNVVVDVHCNALVLWETPFDGVDAGVLARRVPALQHRGSARSPAPDLLGEQLRPEACSFPGGAAVAWMDAGASGDSNGRVFVQRVDVDGQPREKPWVPVAAPGVDDYLPSVACRADGSFMATWTRETAGTAQAVAQRFDADGSPFGGLIAVDEPAEASDNPYAVGTPKGYAVVWTARRQGVWRVVARRIQSDAAMTDVVVVSEVGDGEVFGPRVARLAGGNLVASWTVLEDSARDGVLTGRILAPTADTTSTEFVISAAAARRVTRHGHAVVQTGVGSFAAVWDEVMDPTQEGATSIRLQRFCFADVGEGTCGQTDPSGPRPHSPSSADVLAVLKAATGTGPCCALCVCDVDGSGSLTVLDAQRLLHNVVGTGTPLQCAPCS